MRIHSSLSVLATALLLRPTLASLIPELLHSLEDLQNVYKRCDNPCGYYGQKCCDVGQVCYTDTNGWPACSTGVAAVSTAAAGAWEYSTTTFVQTDLKTVTMTFSSYIPAQTTASAGCQYSLGQSDCGGSCCIAGQWCQSGVCVGVPGGSSGYYSSLYTVTTVVTNTASVPLRPTSNTVTTVTNGAITVTTAFQTPVGTNGAILTGGATQTSSGGLSGGAIAGIVIGVIAALIILLLICACCCFKGLLDGLLSLFGLGPRKKRRTEVIEEERYSHHGRTGGRTWFGMGPRRTEVVEEKKEESGWRRAGTVAAFLGGLALILGLKRRRDRRDDKTSSSYSYYDSDYYTSSSSSSSAGRTRGSRSRSRSRVSRGTRL